MKDATRILLSVLRRRDTVLLESEQIELCRAVVALEGDSAARTPLAVPPDPLNACGRPGPHDGALHAVKCSHCSFTAARCDRHGGGKAAGGALGGHSLAHHIGPVRAMKLGGKRR